MIVQPVANVAQAAYAPVCYVVRNLLHPRFRRVPLMPAMVMRRLSKMDEEWHIVLGLHCEHFHVGPDELGAGNCRSLIVWFALRILDACCSGK